MTEQDVEFDPLSWQPSEELDIAVDAICCGGDGIVAKKKWSLSEDNSHLLFDPLAKQNKWMFVFTMQGNAKGWVVKDQTDTVISNDPDPRLAMIRAALKHHMSSNVEQNVTQQLNPITEIVDAPDEIELLDNSIPEPESSYLDQPKNNQRHKRR